MESCGEIIEQVPARERWRLTSACVLLVLALVAGCRRPAPPKTVRLILESPAVTVLDPIAMTDTATLSIFSPFYEGLVAFDPQARIVPALAASWQTVDERTWRFEFELRPGVRFLTASR